jgi:hypothetical protein
MATQCTARTVARRYILVAALLFTAVLSPAACSDNGFQSALYETLSRDGLLERQYDALLERVLGSLLAPIHYPSTLNLNKPYAAGSLNVYVVNLAAYHADKTPVRNDHVRTILGSLADNALAVPPDTVVIDSQFLEHFILNAWNTQISIAAGMNERRARASIGESSDEADGAISVYGAVADIYRFNNIRHWRSNQSAQDERKSLAAINESLIESGASDMVLLALAPIFYHELGHLSQGTAGSYLDFVQDAAQYFGSKRVLAMEDAADEYAASALKQLTAFRRGHRAAPMQADIDDYESMASSVMLLRDNVLFDVFEGFRGLPAEDQFIDIKHKNCRRHPETASLDFYDPQKILAASREYQPIVTSEEFSLLQRRLMRTIGTGSHAHSFIRGARIVSALHDYLPKGENVDNFMNWYVSFLKAMRDGDPKSLQGDQLDDVFVGLRVDAARLSRALNLELKPAVTCPFRICYVGSFRNGDPGFVELGGPAENLKFIRLVFPLLGQHPSAVLSSVDSDSYRHSEQRLSSLSAAVLGDAGAAASAVGADAVLPVARKCGTIDLLVTGNGNAFRLDTLNPDFWVNVVVFPSPDFPVPASQHP